MGGPSSVVFTAAGRSDVDLGSSGLLHNVSVAGGRIPICLSECDGDADPRCRASGVPGGLFDAPVPILADGMPLCLVVRMTNVAGEADVGTGAIDLQAAIADDVYVTDATKLCPSCAGVCDSGARAGLSCIADRVSTIGGVRYPLSRSCLPDGDPVVSLAFTVPLTTGTSTFPAACLPTIDATCGDCVEKGVCAGDACVDHDESGTCIDAKGGLSQACCARNITRPCFPPDLARTGSAVAPQPATNDVGYPRTASGATLAGGFCVPPSGIPALDDAIGLPGPGALILPVREDWNR